MDIERSADESLGQRALDYLDGVPKVKSPLRMQYAAETKVFKDQHGGLENIRQKLGFSRRKMCQLLLVDPSAWTRWMKDESKVPPHIYRSLEWFLALNLKMRTEPDLAELMRARFRLPEVGLDPAQQPVLRAEIQILRNDLRRQQWVSAFLTAGLTVMMIVSSWLAYR